MSLTHKGGSRVQHRNHLQFLDQNDSSNLLCLYMGHFLDCHNWLDSILNLGQAFQQKSTKPLWQVVMLLINVWCINYIITNFGFEFHCIIQFPFFEAIFHSTRINCEQNAPEPTAGSNIFFLNNSFGLSQPEIRLCATILVHIIGYVKRSVYFPCSTSSRIVS